MNSKRVLVLQTALETAILVAVFALPVAYQLRMYDIELVKALTLQTVGIAAALLATLRWIELGRVEFPANRAGLSAVAAALVLWTAWSFSHAAPREGVLYPALQTALLAALFWTALTQCASTGFAASLSDWAIVGCVIGAATHLLQWSGRLAAVAPPEVSGATLAFAFPVALARMAEREKPQGSRMALALVAAMFLAGVWTSPPVALVALSASCFAYSALCLFFARDPWLRASGLAAAAALPVSVAAAFALGGPEFQRRAVADLASLRAAGAFDASAGGLGLPAALLSGALLAWALALGAVEAARRLKRGELQGGTLLLGHVGGAAALLAAGGVARVLDQPAPAALLWIFAASAAGLALEKGASQVAAIPIPAPASARTALYVPAALAAGWLLLWPVRLHRADAAMNLAMLHLHEQRFADAAAAFDRVEAWHKDAAVARYQSGLLLEKMLPARPELAMARYREAARLAPAQAAPRFRLGHLYAKAGDWKNAADSYAESVRVDPKMTKAYAELVDALQILGRKDDVARLTREWIRASPGDPAAWRNLADQYKERKQPRLARRMLEKAARVSDVARARPDDPRPVY
ncbi:MAG: hypothetical protein HY078_09040 [Elusimicrobia bacterium]|nr:hypothetical protein [Elusimicrobiota bacterium]